MEFLFSHGILANQTLQCLLWSQQKLSLGLQESVRNSIAELLMNPFAVHEVCSCMILGIL